MKAYMTSFFRIGQCLIWLPGVPGLTSRLAFPVTFASTLDTERWPSKSTDSFDNWLLFIIYIYPQYHIMLYYTILYYIILCYIILYYVILYYIILYYIAQRSDNELTVSSRVIRNQPGFTIPERVTSSAVSISFHQRSDSLSFKAARP